MGRHRRRRGGGHALGAKESSGLIKDVWGTAGRPARDAALAWAVDWRGTAKDLGERAFYALLALVVLTLWQRLLPYRPWRRLHRVMPALYLMLAFHTLALMPLSFWRLPMGGLMAVLLGVGSAAALWSLAGRIGRGRNSHRGQVHAVQLLGPVAGRDPLEVLCAMPTTWQGHQPGQFVFASFEGLEGATPLHHRQCAGQLRQHPRWAPAAAPGHQAAGRLHAQPACQ